MSNIITNSIEYFDKNNEKYQNLKDKIKYISIGTIVDGVKKKKITFYDKNKIELFSSRFEIISKYYKNHNIWIWGWGVPNLDNFNTNIIKKLWNYGVSLGFKNDNLHQLFLKNELITSRFKIDDETQLDIHLALSTYLTKIPFYYYINDDISKENTIYEIKDDYYEKSETIYFIYIMDTPDV